MKNEIKKDQITNTSLNSNKTMEYMNTMNKSIINQTETELEMDSNQEKEAKKLIKKANSLSKQRCCCFCNICSSKEKRYLESSNLYYKAGDIYKSFHQWNNAGVCYENSSIMKEKTKESPLSSYEQAYYCFEKTGIGTDSKRMFDKINLLLEKEGKFFQIGKNHENLAIKRENREKYDTAIEHYLQAIKYYEKDGKHNNLKTKILIKLTELMILHNHPQAKENVPIMLEDIGNNYLKNIMTKYQAKDYFGKAILTRIYFNDNIEEAKEYMNKYKKKDKTFEESNIYNFCSDIILYIENGENDKLNSVVQNYKKIYDLDEYMSFILDNIIDRENQKKKIKEKEEKEREKEEKNEEEKEEEKKEEEKKEEDKEEEEKNKEKEGNNSDNHNNVNIGDNKINKKENNLTKGEKDK